MSRNARHVLTEAELRTITSGFPGDSQHTAIAIILAESAGVTNAVRPPSSNPLGGEDRGIWQWNSKAWPAITDDVAFDPIAATFAARVISKNGKDFGPWNVGPNAYGTERTLDIANGKRIAEGGDNISQLTLNAVLVADGVKLMKSSEYTAAIKQIPGVDGASVADVLSKGVDIAGDAAGSVVDSIAPWASGLARLLGNLVDPAFWRRIGVGVLGVALVAVALVLVVRGNLPTVSVK